MNDQHLEAVLRRSLAQQAATIDAGPQWPLPDEDLLVAAPRRSLPWWPIAAAVAAVLAVIGIVVAVRHVASDRHRPATPVRVTRTACATELPPAWHRAINAGTLPNSSGGDVVLGGAPDGAVLVRHADRTVAQTVLVAPDGTARVIQQMPGRGRSVAGPSLIDSRWIVLPIADIAKSVPTLEEFDVFDRATGRLDQRIPIAASPRIGTWALFKGHVYWTEPRSGSSGRLLDRDVTARTTRTVASDGARNLLGSPTGVAWTDAQNQRHVLAGTSPDQVPGLAGTHAGLVSDGRSYAWFGSGGITWYSTATKQTVVVRWFPGLDVTVRAVAGPYVLIESGQLGASGWLIDTRTGAAASFQSTSSVASGNGILAYSAESTVVLHVDQLPRLAC